jgi:hypothetical protein
MTEKQNHFFVSFEKKKHGSNFISYSFFSIHSALMLMERVFNSALLYSEIYNEINSKKAG